MGQSAPSAVSVVPAVRCDAQQQAVTASPGMSTALVTRSDFGPFDILSDWAHERYLRGDFDGAVLKCREAIAVCGPAGDIQTVRFLHYIAGSTLHEQGRYAEAAVEAGVLLATLDEDAGTMWRAKALSLLAEARIGLGQDTLAMDHLAESSQLLGGPVLSYNHLSATQAVALAMRALLLFEQADALLLSVVDADTDGPDVRAIVIQEAALTEATWAALLELTGQPEASRLRLVDLLSRACRMRAANAGDGREDFDLRALALEGFALQRLGDTDGALVRLREATRPGAMRGEVPESQIAHIALALAMIETGDHEEARQEIAAAVKHSHAHREVWDSYTTAALALLETAVHGPHPAVDHWRELSRSSITRLWEDRAGRFAALKDRIRVRELAAQTDRMGRAVVEDPLTGLGNRRLLGEFLAHEGRRMSVIFIDVDHFKAVNDTFSHDVGDMVLKRIAELLREHCRSSDVLIRYGGDEFVVLVAGGTDDAVLVAARVHDAVRVASWSHLVPGLALTVSIGVSADGPTQESLLAADGALLAAKRAGRDRVVAAA